MGGRSRASRRGDHSRYKRYSHFIVAQIASPPCPKAKSPLKSSCLPDRRIVVCGTKRTHSTGCDESLALCTRRLRYLQNFPLRDAVCISLRHASTNLECSAKTDSSSFRKVSL